MVSPLDEILSRFTEEVQPLYGEDLLAVILYGSGAAGDFIPGRSNINVALLLREVTVEQLRRALPSVARWQGWGIVAPLFLDPAYVRASTDVFPIEFLDMQENHRVLYGQDPLRDLAIDRRNLRLQCEHEVKAKLLKLQQLYLEAGRTPRRLESLMLTSFSSFLVLIRGLLRVMGAHAPHRRDDLLAALERQLGRRLMALDEVHDLKRRRESLPEAEVEPLFARYLADVRDLARLADELQA